MKAVMLSIQPKWCELICSGKKTVEVRKSKPKLETPFKCYIYRTKVTNAGKRWNDWANGTQLPNGEFACVGGMVIGEFVCDRIIDIPYSQYFVDYYHTMPQEDLEATCLDMGHIDEYLLSKDGYGWHISDLVIYDMPRELSEFRKICQSDYCYTCDYAVKKNGYLVDCDRSVKRPPQSWCYVKEADNERKS